MTQCLGIRGATTVDEDDLDQVLDATQDLLARLQELNGFDPREIGSIIFTTTADLRATFPARAARRLGWTTVPMLCAQEIDAPHSVQRCVRVMLHWNTDKSVDDVRHAYLRGSRVLRPDWAVPPLAGPEGALEAPERPRLEARAARLAPAAPEPLGPASISRSGRLQSIDSVSFQGEMGAYSNEAIFGALGREVRCVPCPSFQAAFEAVQRGRAQAALLPIENSTTGSIHAVYDLMVERNLQIVAEVLLAVRHTLMAPPGTRLAEITEVLSHPQALMQCDGWIAAHGWKATAVYDTAGAAKTIADGGAPGRAAIASGVSAELYGLDVLATDIQDVKENYTRFWLLMPRHQVSDFPVIDGLVPGFGEEREGKTSIVFASRHIAGGLYGCLAEFALRDVSLCRIESRPDKRTPWNYLFYLDFEGHVADATVAQVLASLERHASYVRVLGSYPSHELSKL